MFHPFVASLVKRSCPIHNYHLQHQRQAGHIGNSIPVSCWPTLAKQRRYAHSGSPNKRALTGPVWRGRTRQSTVQRVTVTHWQKHAEEEDTAVQLVTTVQHQHVPCVKRGQEK